MKLHYYLLIGSICLSLVACAESISDSKIVSEKKPLVSGWVYVSHGLENAYISSHKAKLADLYDEYVGALIDNGLNIAESYWLKPTYGNQNMIWVLNDDIGVSQQQTLLASAKAFESGPYSYQNELIEISGANWRYVGVRDKSRGEGASEYQNYIFSCSSKTGVSVFYWGEGVAQPAPQNQAVLALLTALSSKCQ